MLKCIFLRLHFISYIHLKIAVYHFNRILNTFLSKIILRYNIRKINYSVISQKIFKFNIFVSFSIELSQR